MTRILPNVRRIPLSVPVMRGNEARYLEECITTNWVSYVGPFVERFETAFADAVGARHAVAVNSGTAALHLSLLVAGVVRGDLVVIPDLTFIAPANAARYCGADPVFIDVTPDHWVLDVAKVERYLSSECDRTPTGTRDRATGRRVSAVVPVHILGHSADLGPLLGLAERYGLAVVEDATESLGARYKGGAPGTFGTFGCFSFNGNKIITSGGGGMVVTRSDEDAAAVRHLATQAKADRREYVHDAVGFNYRLTNIQAAVGLAQLEQLEAHVARKREIAARYAQGLRGVPGVTPQREAEWARSTFWLYTILVAPPARRTSRELIADLDAAGIEARPLWAPLHEQAPYLGARTFGLEYARTVYERAVSLPSSVDLGIEDQMRVIDTVRRSLTGD
jgi:perosamine synthetase